MKKLLLLTILLAGCCSSTSSTQEPKPYNLPGYNFKSIGNNWHTFNIKVNGREFKMLGHEGYNSLTVTTLYEIKPGNEPLSEN